MPAKVKKVPALTPAQQQAELQRRIDAMTAEAIAGGHAFQLELLTCADQSICLMCSRRAGKSIGCVALCALTGLKTPNVYCLYLSLTADQSAPRYAECKALLDKFGIPYTPSEADQIVTLHNGSRIRFTGTDDRKRITALLGDQLAAGIVIIDESQSDPGLLEWLIVEVLGPMVSETTVEKPIPGRIVVAGVVPETAAGYFNKIWVQNFDDDTQQHRPDAGWKCIGWGRADNPHELEFRKRLDEELKRTRLSEGDPSIQRNWYGRRVFDKNATAYRYSEAKNAYHAPLAPWLDKFPIPANDNGLPLGTLLAVEPPQGVTLFSVGVDPARTRDRCALVLWGWGTGSADVYQLVEFVSELGSGIRQDQWIDVLKGLTKYYPNILGVRRDGVDADDQLLRDFKIHIEPVIKGPGSVDDRVERTASLLGLGHLHILAGSFLEEQLQTVRWDPTARDKGKRYRTFIPTIPNDVSDAGDYGLTYYFDASVPKKAPETFEEMHERLFRESLSPPVQYGFQEDPALTNAFGPLYGDGD